MSRYSCGFNGQCELNPYGDYPSLAECQGQCQSIESKDVQDLIYQYSPAEAIRLAPTDQLRIINLIIGLKYRITELPTSSDLAFILISLADLPTKGIMALISTPSLYPYMASLFSLQEIIDAHYKAGDMLALTRLPELGVSIDYQRLYISALDSGNCDVADEIEPRGMELSNVEIEHYTFNSPYDCVTAHVIGVYSSFDGFWSLETIASATIDNKDVAFFTRLVRIADDPQELMRLAVVRGGIRFLEQLASRGYYWT